MTRQVTLREISHLRLAMPADDRWVEQLNWIPVSSSEYHLACRYFPLAMRMDDRRPELGLLVHPRYLNDPLLDPSGKWRGVYRPIALRCFPFEAGGPGEDPLSDVTIAADSKYLSRSDGVPFLDESGGPGKLVSELHRLLGLLRQSREMFADALDHYLVAGLLVALADGADADARPPFFVIDQNRLAQMSPTALGAMARHRFLSVDLAVAWAFSLQNLQASHLPKQPGRPRLEAWPATVASDSLLVDDLPLVLDDGELIPLANIDAGRLELAQPT